MRLKKSAQTASSQQNLNLTRTAIEEISKGRSRLEKDHRAKKITVATNYDQPLIADGQNRLRRRMNSKLSQ
jgi:hypothetical protein